MKILRVTVASLEKFTGNRWIGLALSSIFIAAASVEVHPRFGPTTDF